MSIRVSKRCPYMITKTRQCKNRVVNGFYCYVHNRYRKGLRIKKSNIARAGKGLFAEKRFKKDQIITQYRGKKLTKREVDRKYKEQAEYTLCNGTKPNSICRDASITSSSNGRFANSNKGRNNAKFSYNNKKKTFSIKAKKTIRKGSEIYVPYGRSFLI